MFNALLAAPTPQVAQGYAVANNTQYARLSTNTATDGNYIYCCHVDIPPGPLSGLSTDWHAHIKVLYESGTYDGVSTRNAPTATTALGRRFSIRASLADSSDPTNIGNSSGFSNPAEYSAGIGGQLSCELAAVAGSAGCETRGTSTWDAQSDFRIHQNALSRWYDQYASGGLRIILFFAWDAPYAANTLMKVSSLCVTLTPGAATPLVPRTLTAAMFGQQFNHWPLTGNSTATAPLGLTYQSIRSWNYDGPTGLTGTPSSFFYMHGIQTVDWLPLTSAQRQASTGWQNLDYFVAANPGRRRLITLGYLPARHSATGALNTPPTDLASNTTGSWYIFCRELGLRYTGQGHYYEIFNEPFQQAGTGPFVNFGSAPTTYTGFTGTPAQLSQMVVQAAAAIRSVDSSAKIIGPSFINAVNRGSDASLDYIRSCLTANANAMINAVDFIGYHTYPININGSAPSPLAALGFTKNLRAVLVELGFPTKPIYMTEMTTENPGFASLGEGARHAYLRRSVVTLLLGDAYQEGLNWYGANPGEGGSITWVQSDVDAWNAMVTFMTSGPVTAATVNQDGTVSVTIGATSRIY